MFAPIIAKERKRSLVIAEIRIPMQIQWNAHALPGLSFTMNMCLLQLIPNQCPKARTWP